MKLIKGHKYKITAICDVITGKNAVIDLEDLTALGTPVTKGEPWPDVSPNQLKAEQPGPGVSIGKGKMLNDNNFNFIRRKDGTFACAISVQNAAREGVETIVISGQSLAAYHRLLTSDEHKEAVEVLDYMAIMKDCWASKNTAEGKVLAVEAESILKKKKWWRLWK